MLNWFRRLILVNGCLLLLFSATSWAQQPQPILVMGDSLSAGYGIDLESGWVQLLREKLENEDFSHPVVNASVSGETTTGGAARLAKLLQTHKPGIVILELGGNDGLRGQPVKIMRDNLSAMIQSSLDADAEVLLLGMQIPPNYGARYTKMFSDIYPALAEQYQITLVPFMLDGVALNRELMRNDSIHPTAEAQPMILDNVWPYLAPLL
ncbi:arylesterase [Gilvimarinus sp. DA14]|uniref:arylesterase n=1 Tax=Gilvimarinus sp. DA14 TaxID=2956798 RepID=UPI0020B72E83|nr:arylesterase [Gilvimarinus sp. DA14]UTF61126.1 arylesterase [Gilvimarinus sp. DA14]